MQYPAIHYLCPPIIKQARSKVPAISQVFRCFMYQIPFSRFIVAPLIYLYYTPYYHVVNIFLIYFYVDKTIIDDILKV